MISGTNSLHGWMRTFITSLCSLSAAFLLLSCRNTSAGERIIELYAQGDIHGKFEDLASAAGFVNARRDSIGADNVIFIDLGDHNHGDDAAYYYNYVHEYRPGEKHFYTKVAEYVSYDAIVAGNHDVETGKRIYGKIKDESRIPYLGGNVVSLPDNKPYFLPYTILKKNGISIAIVGASTHKAKHWVGREKISGLDYLPLEEYAEKTIDYVRRVENPHIVILAAHESTEDLDPCGADIVLSAHNHIPFIGKMWNGKDSVPVLNSGAYAKKLSGILISLKFDRGILSEKKFETSLIDMHPQYNDSAYLEHFKNDFNRVKDFSGEEIGWIDKDIDPSGIFNGPCLYSNIIHYVQLKESGADISFVSPTKFRGKIPAGPVSYNDILKLYPFENLLYKVSLTGEQIRNWLELSYSNWKNNPVAYDCAAGIVYSVNMSAPLGSRVTVHSLIGGGHFSPDSTYTAAVASYRANGGGELIFQATGLNSGQLEGIFVEKYRSVKEMLYDFFRNERKTAAGVAAVSDWHLKE